MYHRFAVVLVMMTFAAEASEGQGAIARTTITLTKSTERARPTDGSSSGTGGSELLATNFVIQGNTCLTFDSSMDLMGAETLALSILAPNIDIRQTQVIPFFGIDKAPYMFGGKILEGESFYSFPDAGSGVVPVLGNHLSIRVCNNDTASTRYAQLTLYIPHR